ncbi:MAG: hypothetical protein AAB774_01160 [Patescibacteria group bacterium]
MILLTPQVALAHDFLQNNGTFFNANSGFYRQKNETRPWQLISLPESATIKQSVHFGDRIWLVVEIDSKQHLLRQNQPLKFGAVTSVAPATEITLKSTADKLIVFRRTGSEVGLTIFRSSDQFETIVPPLVRSSDELGRIIESDGNLLYLQQTGSTVSVWRNQHGWQLATQVNCAESRLIETPILALACLDGTIHQPIAVDQWVRLNLVPIQDVNFSSGMITGWDLSDEHLFHVWQAGVTTSVLLPTLTQLEVDQTVVNGSRILFKITGNNWQELDWQSASPKLIELTATSSGTVVPIIGSSGLLIGGAKPQISTVVGEWRLITAVGSFSSAHQTPLGLLIWNTGSLTQFAPTDSIVFTKVNPWSSTTSPIQAVEIGEMASFVSVITQSGNGNVNLYKTTDFTHWSRITLPTKPTMSLSLVETRQLPVGTLVEVDGVLTVGPGIAGAEVIYLEQADAGIQVYLSKSSGSLPNVTKKMAVATGEISSSQTKRIILDTLADLEIGDLTSWTAPSINVDEATNYLGRTAALKGTISNVSTDDALFQLLAGALKLHFEGAKTIFQAEDQIVTPAVVDWNSASDQVEAWALSADYQLISRLQPTVPTPSPDPVVAPKKAATTKKATVTAKPVANKTIAVAEESRPTPVLVGATETTTTPQTSSNQTLPMSAVSLVAGLLSFRGRRFRRYLSD